jgi:thiol-disulfide isomerase/thioredoxin
MNKKILVIIGVALIAVAIVYLLVSNGEENTQDTQQTTTPFAQAESMPEPTTTPETPAPSATSPGSYIDYSEDALSTTSGTRLLFFHAPWCPQCRDLEASIQAGTIPSGVTIMKIDYDSNQALRQKYGVKLQTTIVELDANGNKADLFVAYDEPTLDAVVDRLL